MSKRLIIIASILLTAGSLHAQVKEGIDTLECHIVGFSVGLTNPGPGQSDIIGGGNMRDLYSGPYLDFGIEWNYKYKNNLLLTFDADIWFGTQGGSDNLRLRTERMSNVFTTSGYAMGWNGVDGVVTAYNRDIAVRPGIGKIIPVSKKNPDSGILLKLSGGWFMQKTVFNQDFDRSPVPQISGNYGKLYDHLRNGVMLTESVGFVYMSNYSTYINIKISFDVSQCWSWSSRPYVMDDLMGLHGADKNTYFDLMYGFRLSWMFPFTGKTTYDYYYY